MCTHRAHIAEGDEIHHGTGDVLLMVTVGDPGWAGCAMRSHRCGALLWPSSSSSLFFASSPFPSYTVDPIACKVYRDDASTRCTTNLQARELRKVALQGQPGNRCRHWTFLESWRVNPVPGCCSTMERIDL